MKRIVMIGALLFAFLLGACSTNAAKAEQTHPLKIWGQNRNGYYHTLVVIDENTGVNYVVAASSKGIAITPRLNADGSLYTSK